MIVTRVGRAVAAGHGVSVRKGSRGPQVGQQAGACGGELVPPVCKCGRCRRSLLVVRRGQLGSGKAPWGRHTEPQ